MTVSNICILGTIAVYLVGMLIIGFRCARKNESSADFYLGGRRNISKLAVYCGKAAQIYP